MSQRIINQKQVILRRLNLLIEKKYKKIREL